MDTIYRHPVLSDAPALWNLARMSGTLDLNSRYFYLIFCRHFYETSVVAQDASGIVGFACAYRVPASDESLFIWQIAVHPDRRKAGIATAILRFLTEVGRRSNIRYFQASITPSNEASRNLFARWADGMGCPCEESVLFPRECFGDDKHAEEVLFQIGPVIYPAPVNAGRSD